MNPLYLILISYSTVVTYITGLRLQGANKKTWLVISITNNMLLLGFFKYASFCAENLNHLFEVLNSTAKIPTPGFLMPVGISFYSFISIGYVIDVYRGTIIAERNFIRLASFISFFPYLLAGPIERAQNIIPQFSKPPTINSVNISEGLSLFVVGLFKKIALADFLAIYVNKIYGNPSHYQGLSLLLGTYAFAWQIYFDFSGYTDMARGTARMLGFKLMLNFNNPYLSTSLGEFWNRWHISLSSWFKDYLYIPLGGNRHGRLCTYRNMVITMLCAGLWHGAAWNFVIWGALHALGRTITRELERTHFYREKIPKFCKQIFIFHFVCLTWVFFRAETFEKAVTIIMRIFTSTLADPHFPMAGFLFIGAVLLYQYIYESRFHKLLELSSIRIALMVSMIFYMIFFRTTGYEIFLYFRF
jgi:D-alanyl-lipoteichoic acid acyltransferase DltB (MBOAT superfamily)